MTDEADIEESASDSIYELDTLVLHRLIPNSAIIDEILSQTKQLLREHKYDESLEDYDCIIVNIRNRKEFDDTLAWVSPSKKKEINFSNYNDYIGYLIKDKIPVIVGGGNIASSFFRIREEKKEFYSAHYMCADFDDCEVPRFRICGNTYCLLDSYYP